jgi:hypothetical protein
MIFAIPIAVPSPSAASFSVPISTSFRARPLYTLPRFATYRKHMSSCRQLRYAFLPITQSVVSPSSYSPFCSSRTPLPTSCRWLRLQCLSLPIQPRLQGSTASSAYGYFLGHSATLVPRTSQSALVDFRSKSWLRILVRIRPSPNQSSPFRGRCKLQTLPNWPLAPTMLRVLLLHFKIDQTIGR